MHDQRAEPRPAPGDDVSSRLCDCRDGGDGAVGDGPGRTAGRIGNCLHDCQADRCGLPDLARHQDFSQRCIGIGGRWPRHPQNAAPLVLSAGSASWREQSEGRAVFRGVLPAVPEPGRADGAAIRDPRADFHGFRVHRAHDLRAQRVAPGAAAAPEWAGAMGQPGLRWVVHGDGRVAAVYASQCVTGISMYRGTTSEGFCCTEV